MFATVQSYRPALELLNQVDADVITFEMKSSNAMDLEAVAQAIKEKKVCIGVIDHHTLQVESAGRSRRLDSPVVEGDPVERLVISSDCGMGREGMSRRHAFYKMVALVQGANIVRKELRLPVIDSLGRGPEVSRFNTAPLDVAPELQVQQQHLIPLKPAANVLRCASPAPRRRAALRSSSASAKTAPTSAPGEIRANSAVEHLEPQLEPRARRHA
jgi:hypothetical protein